MTNPGTGAGNTIPPVPTGPSVGGIYATAATLVFTTQVVADTVARYSLEADGTMLWGPGNAAQDTSLARTGAGILSFGGTAAGSVVDVGLVGPAGQRGIKMGNGNLYVSGANQIKTDNDMTIAGYLYGQTALAANYTAASLFANVVYVGAKDVGFAPAAGIVFGVSLDTNIYRSAADTIKTDDALVVALTTELDGTLYFGAAHDTALLRQGANQIRTSGYFYADLSYIANFGAAAQFVMGDSGVGGAPGLRFGVAEDTNLYRSAADTLTTDDTFTAGGNITLTSAGSRLVFNNAGQSQATVGAAGGAALLPVSPAEYIKITTAAGARVIPAFAAA